MPRKVLLNKTATLGLSLNRRPQPRLEQHLFRRQRYAFFCGRHHPLFGRTGLADVEIHLLWNREQKRSRAETVFIERLSERLGR